MLTMVFTVLLVLLATAAMLGWSARAAQFPLRVSRIPYITHQLSYQVGLVIIAVLVVAIAAALQPGVLWHYLAIGAVRAPASAVPAFGITAGEPWTEVGGGLAVFATLATTFVMLGPRRALWRDGSRLVPYLPWIVLFSVSNALGEELIFRLGVVVPLVGTVDPSVITLVSAILFGAPHLRGMPSGLVGALMSGVLGWLLARSVLETHGIAWAWGLHALQDIPIYTAMLLEAVPMRRGPSAGDDAPA